VVLVQAYTLEPVTGRLLEGWHGTGFLISADGYIATAAHNLAGAAVVKVMLFGETEFIPAKVIAYLSDQDIGLVKIEATGMPFAEFGDSDSLEVGDYLMAIGHPGSLRWGVHVGPFLRIGQVDYYTVPMVVSKVPSGAGQRGGPVFNMAGQVIGSVSGVAPEITDQTPTAEDLEIAADMCYSDGHEHSEAIPSNAIRQFVEGVMAR
jgi:S1-C subfamily serine protease